MDWLEEIDDSLKQTIKDYIKQGQFDKHEDTYRGLDIFRYNTVYGKNIIVVITKESAPEEWPEFESEDTEKAYDWIDVYVDKGEDAATDFYVNFLYPDDSEDIPAKYLKEENESTSYDIDDNRVFDWAKESDDNLTTDMKDIFDHIVNSKDIIPDTIPMDVTIVVGETPATRWDPPETIERDIEYDYEVDDEDRQDFVDYLLASSTIIEDKFGEKPFTGKQLKDYLHSDEFKDKITLYLEDYFMDEAERRAQDDYDFYGE